MNTSVDIIDSKILKGSNAQKRYIDDYLNSIIIQINTSLKMAKHSGAHCIIEEIPIVFDIPNMSNAESQRIIWSKVIETIQKKGFLVKINSNKDVCRLKIAWVSPVEEQEIRNQIKILQDSAGDF